MTVLPALVYMIHVGVSISIDVSVVDDTSDNVPQRTPPSATLLMTNLILLFWIPCTIERKKLGINTKIILLINKLLAIFGLEQCQTKYILLPPMENVILIQNIISE